MPSVENQIFPKIYHNHLNIQSKIYRHTKEILNINQFYSLYINYKNTFEKLYFIKKLYILAQRVENKFKFRLLPGAESVTK